VRLSAFIEGLELLRPYYHDPDGFHMQAEHDEFLMFATDNPVSDVDYDRLKELGWLQTYCHDDDPYDPEEGWKAYV
jgi:hypothetical protein